MKRIVESHQDYFFDIENANQYLNDVKNAELAIKNLYSMLNDNGRLYIHDLNRVICLYYVKTVFPFFMQSILIGK